MASLPRRVVSAPRLWRDWALSTAFPRDPVRTARYANSQLASTIRAEFEDFRRQVGRAHAPMPRFQSAMEDYEHELAESLDRNRSALDGLLALRSPSLRPSPAVRVDYRGARNGGLYGLNENLFAHLAKDWTDLRPKEWDAAHRRVSDALLRHLLAPPNRPGHSVLVPGCGVGRLAYDIGMAFAEAAPSSSVRVHGTELSLACLRAVDTILNSDWAASSGFSFHPYIAYRKNNFRRQDRLARAQGPTPLPTHRSRPGGRLTLSFSAADVIGGARDVGPVDAVASCFFLDCVPTLAGLAAIRAALRPGGLWVNLGPLAYHTHGMSPAAEDLALAVRESGFELVEEAAILGDLPYLSRPQSTAREQVWRPVCFVARKL